MSIPGREDFYLIIFINIKILVIFTPLRFELTFSYNKKTQDMFAFNPKSNKRHI